MTNWYDKNLDTLIADLESNTETGIKSDTIPLRHQKHGKNELIEQKNESIIGKILRNLGEVTTIILLLAAAMSLAMGIYHGEGYIEFVVIIAIVIMNILLAIIQERSAEKSLSELKRLNTPICIVIRDGRQKKIDSTDVVPGDIVLLKTGYLVPADLRIIESNDLTIDEAILTGESEPSEKTPDAILEEKVAVADQANMAFSGCLVTAGNAKALVVAIGMETQIGHIAEYLNDSQRLKTPLHNRLDNMGKVISLIAIVSAIVMFGVGTLHGAEFWEMIFVAIALAVAAIPETLSLMITLSLTHGVTEMVRKNALIRKIPAVETLGSTSVICTDKTGTITQNLMTIKRLWIEGEEPFSNEIDFNEKQMALLCKFALDCNSFSEIQNDGTNKVFGVPTERAIQKLLEEKGQRKIDLDQKYPRVAEIPFSSVRKKMTTIHVEPSGGYLVLTKGAFESMSFSDTAKDIDKMRHEIHDQFANDALRVIAIGSKHIDALPNEDELAELEKDLSFEGMIGLIDPPREECATAIATARNAGIRTVMISGDHAATARAIAKQIGLISGGGRVVTGIELVEMSDDELIENVANYSVYARVSPEDKIRIIEAWQEHGEVVAMTGDGVNDAPALKAADVGISMGITGTEVAKSASDVVLTDDNFSTIVEAVRQGREVFSNIKKIVDFLLVCNFSEIVIMLGAVLMGWKIPLTPIMLLLINLLGDGIPGLQLAREKADPKIMQRHPIGRNESLFDGLILIMTTQVIAFSLMAWIGYYIGTFVEVSKAYLPSHEMGQTITFLIVGYTSILHIFSVRSHKSVFKSRISDNPRLGISAAIMIIAFALFVIVPPIANVFGMVTISMSHWLIVIGLSIVPTIVAEIGKLIGNKIEQTRYKKRLVRHRN